MSIKCDEVYHVGALHEAATRACGSLQTPAYTSIFSRFGNLDFPIFLDLASVVLGVHVRNKRTIV